MLIRSEAEPLRWITCDVHGVIQQRVDGLPEASHGGFVGEEFRQRLTQLTPLALEDITEDYPQWTKLRIILQDFLEQALLHSVPDDDGLEEVITKQDIDIVLGQPFPPEKHAELLEKDDQYRTYFLGYRTWLGPLPELAEWAPLTLLTGTLCDYAEQFIRQNESALRLTHPELSAFLRRPNKPASALKTTAGYALRHFVVGETGSLHHLDDKLPTLVSMGEYYDSLCMYGTNQDVEDQIDGEKELRYMFRQYRRKILISKNPAEITSFIKR